MKKRTPRPQPKKNRSVGQSIRRFFHTLFDFSFNEFITVQMFPVLYGIILTSSLIGVVYLVIEAFFTSWIRGLFYLFVAAPIGFITIATITRAVMEFYIVVFRIAENADEMRNTIDKFSGLSDNLTKKIPFWRSNTGKSLYPDEESSERQKKRRKDEGWPY